MQGLQVWNENSEKTLDTSTHTTSVLGSLTITNAGTYTVSDDKFSYGTPFFMLSKHYSGVDVLASVDGNKYTFKVKELGYGSYDVFDIIYGVY